MLPPLAVWSAVRVLFANPEKCSNICCCLLVVVVVVAAVFVVPGVCWVGPTTAYVVISSDPSRRAKSYAKRNRANIRRRLEVTL